MSVEYRWNDGNLSVWTQEETRLNFQSAEVEIRSPAPLGAWVVHHYDGVTAGGYSLESVCCWSNDKLEATHDYIQWLFPTDEKSLYNPTAPTLTASDCEVFRQSESLRSRLGNSFVVFLKFLGLEYVEGVVGPAKDFDSRSVVFQVANHNWLRITRVILSLRLLGLPDEAKAFYTYLTILHKERGWASSNAFSYWENAATCPIS